MNQSSQMVVEGASSPVPPPGTRDGRLAGADGKLAGLTSTGLPSTWLADLAFWNPRAALGIIMGIPRIPIAMNARTRFDCAAPDAAPNVGALDTIITQETWIEQVKFTITQPKSFQGNVLKPQHDYYFQFTSGVDVQAEINSGPRYVLSIEPTPIQNFANVLGCCWPAGWPLFCEQGLRIWFRLREPPPSIPLFVTMTFLGWSFIDKCIDRISDEYARAKLRELGINSPSLDAIREF